MKGLKGKVAVIAGGGRGIGRATALKLAEYGANVIVGSRSEHEYTETARQIRSLGAQAEGFHLDVSNRDTVKQFVEAAVRVHGRIDILVYSSGVNVRLPAINYPEEIWQKVMDTNVTGAFRVCQEVGPIMIEQRDGAIVHVTSMMSHTVTPNQSAYASSKGALLQYTKLLAVEWAPYQIRVNAVSPGYIETEMTEDARQQSAYTKGVLDKTAQGRFGDAFEVAEGICFLASPAASYITGACLPVDGGFLAGHPAIVAKTLNF